jgi:hypothetical protein
LTYEIKYEHERNAVWRERKKLKKNTNKRKEKKLKKVQQTELKLGQRN